MKKVMLCSLLLCTHGTYTMETSDQLKTGSLRQSTRDLVNKESGTSDALDMFIPTTDTGDRPITPGHVSESELRLEPQIVELSITGVNEQNVVSEEDKEDQLKNTRSARYQQLMQCIENIPGYTKEERSILKELMSKLGHSWVETVFDPAVELLLDIREGSAYREVDDKLKALQFLRREFNLMLGDEYVRQTEAKIEVIRAQQAITQNTDAQGVQKKECITKKQLLCLAISKLPKVAVPLALVAVGAWIGVTYYPQVGTSVYDMGSHVLSAL